MTEDDIASNRKEDCLLAVKVASCIFRPEGNIAFFSQPPTKSEV